VQKIREVWQEGPFNIAGVSWGGILATEIAKILDKEYNAKVYLYLIDGAPLSLQSAIQLLGKEDDFEVNLLSRVFNSHDSQVCSEFTNFYNENLI